MRKAIFWLVVLVLASGQVQAEPADPAPEAFQPGAKPAAHDPLIGTRVESGIAKVGNTEIDKSKYLEWPATVKAVEGEWLWLGRAWMRRFDVMDLATAFDFYMKEVRRNPQSARAWRSRGVCWEVKGKRHNAVKDYDQAIKFDSKYAAAYNNRGSCKCALKDYAGAIKDLDEAIRLDIEYVASLQQSRRCQACPGRLPGRD